MLAALVAIRGKDMAVELTVVHPAAVSAPRPAAGSAQAFLAQAARVKCQARERKCNDVGVAFTPMVFDTWGGVHGAGKALWHQIATKAPGKGHPQARAAQVGLLRQGLAVASMRGVVPQLQVLLSIAADPLPWWNEPLPNQTVDEAGNVVHPP